MSTGIGSSNIGMNDNVSVKWRHENDECLLVDAPLLRGVSKFDNSSSVVGVDETSVALGTFEDFATFMNDKIIIGKASLQVLRR